MRKSSVVKIENNDYTVISTVKYEKASYAYLINNNNYKDVLFVKYTKEEVEVIEEKEKLNKLIELFNFRINTNLA